MLELPILVIKKRYNEHLNKGFIPEAQKLVKRKPHPRVSSSRVRLFFVYVIYFFILNHLILSSVIYDNFQSFF